MNTLKSDKSVKMTAALTHNHSQESIMCRIDDRFHHSKKRVYTLISKDEIYVDVELVNGLHFSKG